MPDVDSSTSPTVEIAAPRPPRLRARARFNQAMRIVRRAHLYTGLFMTPWVFLYGISGMLLNHPDQFPDQAPTYFGPTTLESVPPPAWAYGESVGESDAFVAQVLADERGETTATAEEYAGELPDTGVLSILCDGSGVPRALVEVTGVTTSGEDVVESFKVVYQA